MNLLTLIHNLNERLIKTVQNNINKHVDNIGNDVVDAMSKLPFTDSNIEAIFNDYGISTIGDALNITEWHQLKDIFNDLQKYKQPFDLKVFQYFTNLKKTSSFDTWGEYGLSLQGSYVTEIIFPKNLENIAPKFCAECSQLKKVIFLGNKIDTIDSEAFAGCSSLTSIELPTSIKSIGIRAFARTNISGTLNLHGATDIDDDAFSMTNIDNIVWDSLTEPCTIENGAFAETSLKNVTLPEGVEAINISAFNKISQLNLPSTFKAFKPNKSWQNFYAVFNDDFIINIADNNPYMKAINNAVVSKDGTTLYKLFSYAQIPDGVIYIAPYAIKNAKFNELIIPETCTKIDSHGINDINCKVLSLNSKPSLDYESFYQIKTDNLLLGKKVKTYSLRNSRTIRNLNALNIYTANKKLYDKLITAMPNNVFMLDDYGKDIDDTNEIPDIDISIDAFRTKINTLLSTYGKQDLDKNGKPTENLRMLNWQVSYRTAWICIGFTLESQNVFKINIHDKCFTLSIENYKWHGLGRSIKENFKVFDLFMANNKASRADSNTNTTGYKYTENNINIIEKLLKEMVKPSNDYDTTILNSEFINNRVYTPAATFKYIAKRFSNL